MSKNKHRIFKQTFNHKDLTSRMSKYDYMSCYSYNKKNNQNEFDEMALLFNVGYPFDSEKIQSIDCIISGTTNGQYLITAIFGRIDNENMYDRDVFNIFPDSPSGDTYSIIQSLHFKDDNNRRLTDNYSISNLPTNEEKIDELYQVFLTGKTTNFSIKDYSKDSDKFIKACHSTYKRYLK